MSEAPALTTFDILSACVVSLGAAILPIWGVDEAGVCLCPTGAKCRSPGKHPNGKLCPNGVKNATRDLAILRQWVRAYSRGNWAIRCGDPLPNGGFLGVFDWDPRNGSADSLAELEAKGCKLPDTVTAASGGGGGHRLYRFPVSPAARTVGPGLDLQGAGKYIVICPSHHASGGSYTWELGQGPGDTAVAEAPSWLIEGTQEAVPRPGLDGGTARETVLGEAFTLAGRAGAVMPDGSMMVNCVQSDMHSDARGRGQDASAIILPPAGGSRFGGYKCQHGHCANLKWQDVVKLLPKEAYEAAQRKYPRLGAVPSDAQPAPPVVVAKPAEIDLDGVKRMLNWKQTKNGYKIVSDIVNLSIILRYDPRWKGVLQFDSFSQTLRTVRMPPWHADDMEPGLKPGPWTDADTTRLDLWLRRTWALELSQDKIISTTYVVGRRECANPLVTYLQGLQWDGQARLDMWLVDRLGCTDTPYVRSVGRKWMISAVARALDPGCKVDTLLVLEGSQGKGKSSALRALVPETDWFSDTPIPIGDKDSFVAMRGKWIIELAELASLKKADLDRTKAFFSSPVDSYRPPYGREMVSIPRTAIFAGTVNLGEYLNDSTGARRFFPVEVGVIDLQGLRTDRDQLWAEAVSIYLAWKGRGSPASECLWWPAPEEITAYETEQSNREIEHPWTVTVGRWLQSERCAGLLRSKKYVTLMDACEGALDLKPKDVDHATHVAVGIIMTRRFGWRKRRVTVEGGREFHYVPPLPMVTKVLG